MGVSAGSKSPASPLGESRLLELTTINFWLRLRRIKRILTTAIARKWWRSMSGWISTNLDRTYPQLNIQKPSWNMQVRSYSYAMGEHCTKEYLLDFSRLNVFLLVKKIARVPEMNKQSIHT